MKKQNKLKIYVESFLMTAMLGITLTDLNQELDKLKMPIVEAGEENLVKLEATSPRTDIEVIFEDEDIKTVIKEAIDANLKEETKVSGNITPVSSNQVTSEEETQHILDEQLEEVVDTMIEEEINESNYSGMKVSHEYEDYLKEVCQKYSEKFDIDYNTLYKIVMTIGYRESAGNWNNNGVYSKTNDLGEFQINTCNVKEATELFGYTMDDLKNDRYKNANYAVYHICTIIRHNKCKSLEDVFGMYNGWTGWRKMKDAVNYSRGCMEIMNEYFSDYQESNVK